MLNKKCYEILHYLRHFTLMLLMCVVFVTNANIAFADTIQPENPSDNVVTIDNEGYTINGKRYEFKSNQTFWISGGGTLLGTGEGDASNNTVEINNYSNDEAVFIYGGYSQNGEASNNTISINDSDLSNKTVIFSGAGKTAANKNDVTITNSKVVGVVGGNGLEEANNNNITFNSGTAFNLTAATSSNGSSNQNSVTLNDGKVLYISVGSGGNGDSNGNVVNINGGEVTSSVFNEYTSVDNTYSAGVIEGGVTTNGNANDNVVNINGGTVESIITAGSAHSGNANNNVININDGYVGGKQTSSNTGAIFNYTSAGLANDGNAINNTININGGTVEGYVLGGWAYNGNAMDNIINIRNNPNLTNANLSGYYATGEHSGNTLNIYSKSLTIKSVQSFDLINFYLGSANTENGDTMLTATTANLEDTKIYGIVDGDTSLKNGDQVTLLTADNLTTNDGTTYEGQIAQGVSFLYPVTVTKNDNSIIATVGESSSTEPTSGDNEGNDDTTGGNTSGGEGTSGGGSSSGTSGSGGSSSGSNSSDGSGSNSGGGFTPSLLEQTNIIPSAPSIAPRSIISHIDSTINWLPPDDFSSVGTTSTGSDTSSADTSNAETSGGDEQSSENAEAEKKELGNEKHAENHGFEAFGNIGTSVMTTDTGNGSHVKSRTSGIDVGLARVFDNGHGGKTHVAPIFDYGGGSYDSYLADGTHGSGKTHFFLGGIIARKTEENGFYYEGSFRMGRSTVDFKSDDLLQGETPTHVEYSSSARVWAAHIHIGRKLFLSPGDSLNMYGIYYHTHQGSMDAQLSTGENYRFDAVNNRRLRIGARLTRHANPHSVFYSGIAYQWESASAANATVQGERTNNSGVSGSSFMLELGWQYKPVASSPWTIDVGAVGWAGHQRGVSAQIKAKMAF